MPTPIQTFTNGLSRQSIDYLSDDGTSYLVDIRQGYVTTAATDQTGGGMSVVNTLPVGSKPRRIHFESTAPVNGRIERREMPASLTDITAYFGASPSKANVTIDGVTWKAVSYTGELRRG